MKVCPMWGHRLAVRCCAAQHVRALQSCLDDVQVAEMMAKVAEQVREAEEEAERRGPVLTALQDLASMRTECAWLASYEKDDARFKVRFQRQSSAMCSSLRACMWIHIHGWWPRGFLHLGLPH